MDKKKLVFNFALALATLLLLPLLLLGIVLGGSLWEERNARQNAERLCDFFPVGTLIDQQKIQAALTRVKGQGVPVLSENRIAVNFRAGSDHVYTCSYEIGNGRVVDKQVASF